MYVSEATVCDLFVYSPACSVTVEVHRGEQFLQEIIPKIENLFFLPLPFFVVRLLRYLSIGCFSIPIPLPILPSGGGTGLRGTFLGHPRPFHLTFTDVHNNIYTPMGALPDGTRTRADLAVLVERVLILPSTPYRQPRGDIHTHPWPGGGFSLGKILPLR
jgi:hypothetical protein